MKNIIVSWKAPVVGQKSLFINSSFVVLLWIATREMMLESVPILNGHFRAVHIAVVVAMNGILYHVAQFIQSIGLYYY